MAIEIVGIGTPIHGNNTNVVPVLPTGIAKDDVLLIFDKLKGDGTLSINNQYTTIGNIVGGTNRQLSVMLKVHDGSEPNPTVSVSGGASNETHSAVAVALRGSSGVLDAPAVGMVNSANLTGAGIKYGSLNVNSDGCIVFLVVGHNDNYPNNNLITPPGFQLLGSFPTTVGGDQAFTVFYQQQTQKNNIPAGAVKGQNDTTSVANLSLIFAVKPSDTAPAIKPAWTVNPVVGQRDTNAFTVNFTSSVAATIYAGAYLTNVPTPTAAVLKAGTNAQGFSTKTTNGNNDAVTVNIANATLPVYTLHAVLENAGGFSEVVSLPSEQVLPPIGFQFVTVDVPWGTTEQSILENASPPASDGDIIVCSSVTTPGNYSVTMASDGAFSFNPGSDTTRQSIVAQLYYSATCTYSNPVPVPFWVNNTPPTFVGQLQFELSTGVPINSIDITSLFIDSEGDQMIITIENELPPGLTLSPDNKITGIPTTPGNYSTVIKATDVTGDFTTITFIFNVSGALPNVIGMTSNQALNAFANLSNVSVNTTVSLNATVNNDIVFYQKPAGNTPLTSQPMTVDILVSSGSPAPAYSYNGNAFDTNGRLITIPLLDNEPVPSNAVIINEIARDPVTNGTYTCKLPSAANIKLSEEGFAIRLDGALVYTTVATSSIKAGVHCTDQGEVYIVTLNPTSDVNGYGVVDQTVCATRV